MFMAAIVTVLVQAPRDSVPFTLDAAVRRGVEVSPAVAAARGAVLAPRAERAEAFWPFPDNPSLEWTQLDREGPSGASVDRNFVLRQSVAVSGANFVRRSAAGARYQGALDRVADAERLAALEVRVAFAGLVIAQRRAALLDSAARFAERLEQVARARLEAGAVNQLDYNTAVLEAARQRSTAERAEADHVAAAAMLGRLLALGPDSMPRAERLPNLPEGPIAADEPLIATALAERPDRAAASQEVRAAEREGTAARLAFVPTLQLGAVVGQEAGTDDLRGFTFGLSVPLFHRGQTERGRAGAVRAAAAAELDAVQRSIRAEVTAAAERLRRARLAERRFAARVLAAAADNVGLSEIAFEEGKVGIASVVVLRTAAVAAQLEYLEVLGDAYESWFALAAALGVSPQNVQGGRP